MPVAGSPSSANTDHLSVLVQTEDTYPLAATATPGAASYTRLTANGNFFAAGATLFAVSAAVDGVTIGDTIEIRDDTSIIITFTASSADMSFVFTPSVGITCNTNINVNTTLSVGGTWETTVLYKAGS